MKAQLKVTAMPTADNMRRVMTRVTFGLVKEAVTVNQSAFKARVQPPNAVKYPIQWASEKQRRAFFATDGFGGGIPYKRTGKLANNSTLIAAQTADGGTVILQIPSPGQYVFGNFRGQYQQPMHRNTGYPSGVIIRRDTLNDVNTTIQANYVDTLLSFGFLKTSRI
jgi:hypothetical protein